MARDALNLQQRPFRAGLLWGLAHTFLFALAFPPFNLWPLALGAIAPLVWAALRTQRPLRTVLAVSLASVPAWAFHHQYIWAMSAAGIFPLVAYLSIYPGLFVLLLSHMARRFPGAPLALLVPIAWTGLEVLRGEVVWHGYPWYLIAHPLIPVSAIANIASFFGVYGVGAWLAMATGWAFDLRRVPSAFAPFPIAPLRAVRPVGVVLALVFFFSAAMIPPRNTPGDEAVNVAVIQTNVPQSNRTDWTWDQRMEDFRAFMQLTVKGAFDERGRPDLIVWPETMFPGGWMNKDAVDELRRVGASGMVFLDQLLSLQSNIETPMIIGAPAAEGLRLTDNTRGGLDVEADHYFNSAFVVDMGAVDERRYDKVHLTPFGEVMPYISRWKWLERALLAVGARGMRFDLSPGTSTAPLEIRLNERPARSARTLRAAAPVCYEITMSGLCRELVFAPDGRRADVIINLTNDGWFAWFDAGRANKLLQARWRAIELATPVVRAANTGISAVIDDAGRVLVLGPNNPEGAPRARAEGVLWAAFDPPIRRPTLYSRIGNAPGWAFLGALTALTLLMLLTRPKPKNDDEGPALRLVRAPDDPTGTRP